MSWVVTLAGTPLENGRGRSCLVEREATGRSQSSIYKHELYIKDWIKVETKTAILIFLELIRPTLPTFL